MLLIARRRDEGSRPRQLVIAPGIDAEQPLERGVGERARCRVPVGRVAVEIDGRSRLGQEALNHADLRFLRSEEHTSELQSRLHLVCRLLLEKKKITYQFFRLHHSSSSSPG